jgi:hypothetical protein
MNKRILICESRGDSNRCTPYRGKPDQHDTYACHASSRTPGLRFLWVVPVRGNLSYSRQQIWTDLLHPRRRAPNTIHSTPAIRYVGPYPASLPQQPMEQWEKSSFCWQLTIRLIGPTSPACDRYVQYLLTGTNPSVLNRHRRGIPHRKPQNSHSTLPALPFWGFHLSP